MREQAGKRKARATATDKVIKIFFYWGKLFNSHRIVQPCQMLSFSLGIASFVKYVLFGVSVLMRSLKLATKCALSYFYTQTNFMMLCTVRLSLKRFSLSLCDSHCFCRHILFFHVLIGYKHFILFICVCMYVCSFNYNPLFFHFNIV